MEGINAVDGSGRLNDGVLEAARADMEFHTSLPALRHYLENLLAAFTYAVFARDDRYLAELMKGVAVHLEGCPGCSGSQPSPEQIISWFSTGATSRRQTITNLSVHFQEGFVLYSAVYQEWEATPEPRCIAMGTCHGRLKAERQVWKWIEHSTRRTSPGCCSYACPGPAASAAAGAGGFTRPENHSHLALLR